VQNAYFPCFVGAVSSCLYIITTAAPALSQVVTLMDCEDGSLRIKCYNRSSAITTQTSISAIERVCLLSTAHSCGWRLWYKALVCNVNTLHYTVL
jgi:hypothetical protein